VRRVAKGNMIAEVKFIGKLFGIDGEKRRKRDDLALFEFLQRKLLAKTGWS